MTCEQLDESLSLYALGALTGPEQEGVRKHLAEGCAICAGKLAETQTVLSQLALSTLDSAVEIPTGAKAKLDSLIKGETVGMGLAEEAVGPEERASLKLIDDDSARVVPSVKAGPGRSYGWGRVLLAACLAAGVTAGLFILDRNANKKNFDALQARLSDEQLKLFGAERFLDAAHTELDALKKKQTETDNLIVALRTDLAATQQVASMLYSKQLMTVDLKGTDGSPDTHARLLVDLQNKIWKLYATDLKPVDNRVYEFWLITDDGKKVAMGSFKPDGKGSAVLQGTVPDPMPKLSAAALSDEPAPVALGVSEPTGAVHAMGEIR